jgi:hypothetical protein
MNAFPTRSTCTAQWTDPLCTTRMLILIDCHGGTMLESWFLLAVCSPVCQNQGTCVGKYLRWYSSHGLPEIKTWTSILAPNSCVCQAGYNGSVCQTGECCVPKLPFWLVCSLLFVAICQTTCFNGGMCIAPDQCNCTSSWSGNLCNIPRCNPICRNRGRALTDSNFVADDDVQ